MLLLCVFSKLNQNIVTSNIVAIIIIKHNINLKMFRKYFVK